MNNFEYYTPTRMIFGKDTHKKAGEVISAYGFKKVLLHYGMGSVKKSGLYGEVTDALKAADISYIELGGVCPNPKLAKVKEGIELCRENGVDFILAVGGGSVIDSAKLIAAGSLYDGDPWDFSLKKQTPKAALPVGCILTIAASGSEMSDSCVISNDGLKRGFSCELNRPLFSICNPCLTYTVSPYQTACGIVDIMMHTAERYFTVSEPFDVTDEIAEGVLRSVIRCGRAVMKDPCDYEARANLMWAGSLSHNSLTGAGTKVMMVCHQLEHELSGMFDSVAHGAGLAVIFPAWEKYIYKYNPQRFAKFAMNVWAVPDGGRTAEEIAKDGIDRCEDFFKNCLKMPVRLSELGINVSDDDIRTMSEKCTNYGKRILDDYTELAENEIAEIFKIARG